MNCISVSKTTDELVLEWSQEKAITTGTSGMSQFEIDDIQAVKCHESFVQIGKSSKIFCSNTHYNSGDKQRCLILISTRAYYPMGFFVL